MLFNFFRVQIQFPVYFPCKIYSRFPLLAEGVEPKKEEGEEGKTGKKESEAGRGGFKNGGGGGRRDSGGGLKESNGSASLVHCIYFQLKGRTKSLPLIPKRPEIGERRERAEERKGEGDGKKKSEREKKNLTLYRNSAATTLIPELPYESDNFPHVGSSSK